MQERRYRPGDVLDDYCPRERRITDHAIVAMIDDEIRRTRCAVCDAEHEYKEAKVPAPRRKTQPPALFNQVLDGMNGPTRPHAPEPVAEAALAEHIPEAVVPMVASAAVPPEPVPAPEPVEPAQPAAPIDAAEPVEAGEAEGGFRRSLIRATFPRPDGQQPPARDIPEFTIHSLHNRRNGQRHAGAQNKFRGGRRRPGGGSMDHIGPMRFREHGHGQNTNNGQGGGRRRRGGKKNR